MKSTMKPMKLSLFILFTVSFLAWSLSFAGGILDVSKMIGEGKLLPAEISIPIEQQKRVLKQIEDSSFLIFGHEGATQERYKRQILSAIEEYQGCYRDYCRAIAMGHYLQALSDFRWLFERFTRATFTFVNQMKLTPDLKKQLARNEYFFDLTTQRIHEILDYNKNHIPVLVGMDEEKFKQWDKDTRNLLNNYALFYEQIVLSNIAITLLER